MLLRDIGVQRGCMERPQTWTRLWMGRSQGWQLQSRAPVEGLWMVESCLRRSTQCASVTRVAALRQMGCQEAQCALQAIWGSGMHSGRLYSSMSTAGNCFMILALEVMNPWEHINRHLWRLEDLHEPSRHGAKEFSVT